MYTPTPRSSYQGSHLRTPHSEIDQLLSVLGCDDWLWEPRLWAPLTLGFFQCWKFPAQSRKQRVTLTTSLVKMIQQSTDLEAESQAHVQGIFWYAIWRRPRQMASCSIPLYFWREFLGQWTLNHSHWLIANRALRERTGRQNSILKLIWSCLKKNHLPIMNQTKLEAW